MNKTVAPLTWLDNGPKEIVSFDGTYVIRDIGGTWELFYYIPPEKSYRLLGYRDSQVGCITWANAHNAEQTY